MHQLQSLSENRYKKIKFWEVARCGGKPDRQYCSCEKEFYLNNRMESEKQSLIRAQS